MRKGVDGEVEVLHNNQLGADQQAAFGVPVGGLIGLGAAGEEGLELGAERAAELGRAACGWAMPGPSRRAARRTVAAAPVAAAAAAPTAG